MLWWILEVTFDLELWAFEWNYIEISSHSKCFKGKSIFLKHGEMVMGQSLLYTANALRAETCSICAPLEHSLICCLICCVLQRWVFVLLTVGSQVPLFLQSHSRSRRLYSGLSESCGFRTSFEMVELRSTPPQYSHLAGLLDVFKAKLVRYMLHCDSVLKCACCSEFCENVYFH